MERLPSAATSVEAINCEGEDALMVITRRVLGVLGTRLLIEGRPRERVLHVEVLTRYPVRVEARVVRIIRRDPNANVTRATA